MQCKIKETGQMKVLSMRTETGEDFTEGFISNYNGLKGFKYNPDYYYYEVSEEDYSWWARIIDKQIQLNAYVSDLKHRFHNENVDQHQYDTKLNDMYLIMEAELGTDLEDQAGNTLKNLKKRFN